MRFLGDYDWYREGCEILVRPNVQNPDDGSWRSNGPFDMHTVVSTSFALLFLSKGRTPLLVSKLVHGPGNDWDNDRHQEGFGVYMNLGVASWRRWLSARIADVIERYGVDAYFLDIIGGWVNNTKADMHEGARQLVAELRARYPHVLACGEFLYDALLEFIPLYHVYTPRGGPYARFFSHLSHPAPGRGSSGVHESGFNHWDAATLSLSKREGLIPTLNVVDDTFTKYRDQMAAVIAQAKAWRTP
jgi:hypothetical protein